MITENFHPPGDNIPLFFLLSSYYNMIVFNNFTIPKGLGMDYSVYQDYIQDNTVEEYCFTYVSDDFVDTCIDKVSLVKKKQPGKVKDNTKKNGQNKTKRKKK